MDLPVCTINIILLAPDSSHVEEFKEWVVEKLQPGGPTFPTEFRFKHPETRVIISEQPK